MNRQELSDYITKTQSEVERLSKELTVLSCTDFTLYPENYEPSCQKGHNRINMALFGKNQNRNGG